MSRIGGPLHVQTEFKRLAAGNWQTSYHDDLAAEATIATDQQA